MLRVTSTRAIRPIADLRIASDSDPSRRPHFLLSGSSYTLLVFDLGPCSGEAAWQAARRAALGLIERLGPRDWLAVIGVASRDSLLPAWAQSGSQQARATWEQQINRCSPSPGSAPADLERVLGGARNWFADAGAEGTGRERLKVTAKEPRRIWLFTDLSARRCPPLASEWKSLAEQYRELSVRLSVFDVGPQSLPRPATPLAALARATAGAAHLARSPNDWLAARDREFSSCFADPVLRHAIEAWVSRLVPASLAGSTRQSLLMDCEASKSVDCVDCVEAPSGADINLARAKSSASPALDSILHAQVLAQLAQLVVESRLGQAQHVLERETALASAAHEADNSAHAWTETLKQAARDLGLSASNTDNNDCFAPEQAGLSPCVPRQREAGEPDSRQQKRFPSPRLNPPGRRASSKPAGQ